MGIENVVVPRRNQNFNALILQFLKQLLKILMTFLLSVIGQVSTDNEKVWFLFQNFLLKGVHDLYDIEQIFPVPTNAVPLNRLPVIIDPGGRIVRIRYHK